MYTIGIDIGGMSIKAGLVDEKGKIIYRNKEKTLETAEKVIEKMKEQIYDLLSQAKITVKDIKGIGIGSPGSITSSTGVVEEAYNLGWHKVRICDELKKEFDTEIKVSNDANVACLGETVFGAAKGYNDVVMFTLGTGVGGGIVIDGKLFEGNESKGVELGHTVLVLGGEPCTCTRRGCIEAYVSATALIKQTKKAMQEDKASKMWEYVGGDIENVDGKTAFECSKLGDKKAIEVRDMYIYYLAESMLNMFNIFRPQAFILGGGVSAQGEYLVKLLDDYCKVRNYGFGGTPAVKILTATLGNDAGIIGATALIK